MESIVGFLICLLRIARAQARRLFNVSAVPLLNHSSDFCGRGAVRRLRGRGRQLLIWGKLTKWVLPLEWHRDISSLHFKKPLSLSLHQQPTCLWIQEGNLSTLYRGEQQAVSLFLLCFSLGLSHTSTAGMQKMFWFHFERSYLVLLFSLVFLFVICNILFLFFPSLWPIWTQNQSANNQNDKKFCILTNNILYVI